MPNPKVFCLLPALKEEKTIIEVINNVRPLVNVIVVIDDCSTDNTFNLARKQGVKVLRHIIHRGQGAALQTGTEYALAKGADIIVHFDADNQFIAEEIRDMIEPILSGEADVVFGSRFLEKKSQIPWLKKNIILPLARLVNKIFLGVTMTDPQNGFRALSASAAKKIIINHDGMAHCSEILAKVFANKFRIKEAPVTVIYRDFGQRFNEGLKILKEMLLARLLN